MDRRTPSLGVSDEWGRCGGAWGQDAKTGLSSGQLRSWLGPTLYSRSRVPSLARWCRAGRAERLGRFPRPGPRSRYASSSPSPSRSFSHGPQRLGCVSLAEAGECGETGSSQHCLVHGPARSTLLLSRGRTASGGHRQKADVRAVGRSALSRHILRENTHKDPHRPRCGRNGAGGR
jgi:hypothetical protein